MEILDPPNIDFQRMPEGTKLVVMAINQQDKYRPLPSARTPDGRVVSAWLPTAEDLAKLLDGEAVYLTVKTFNEPLQPVLVTVGQPTLKEEPSLGPPNHGRLVSTLEVEYAKFDLLKQEYERVIREYETKYGKKATVVHLRAGRTP